MQRRVVLETSAAVAEKGVTVTGFPVHNTAPCSGCGSRSPRSELTEDNHDNLTYFHGDELCRQCAAGTGVIW